MPDLRDYDVIQRMRDLLVETGEFDEVFLGDVPEHEKGLPVQAGAAAYLQVYDFDETTGTGYGDADDSDVAVRTVRFTLILSVRDEDRETRDRRLDRVLQASSNKINGQSVGALTLPKMTQLARGRVLKAVPPERRMECRGVFAYLIEDDDRHATEA